MQDINWLDVKKKYDEGMTYREMGIHFGCSQSRIGKIAKRHKFTKRRLSKHRHILIQKSTIPLSMQQTDIYSYVPKNVDSQTIETILGSLLGDSCLKKRIYIKKTSYHIYMTHCEKQFEYLRYKHDLIGKFANNIFLEKKAGRYPIKGKECNVQAKYSFATKPMPLKYIDDLLYGSSNKRKKIVSSKYLSYLTPLSLAMWYMDDGNYHKQNRLVRFDTMGFTHRENKLIQKYFYENLKIPCYLYRENCGYGWAISLTRHGSKKFLKLVFPYRSKCMSYKFVDPSETSKAV